MENNIFDIKSVAIIGASANPAKLGYDIVKNLIEYKFKGPIYPVNLKENEILGLRSYKNIKDVVDTIDLAVISIPASDVIPALEDCINKMVKFVVIISAGFKEIGKEGVEPEKRLKQIIKNTNTKVIGPNCLGIINSKINLDASFAAGFPEFDNISFISQSGALGTAFLDWSNEYKLGLQYFISLGNKVDIDENYLLENIKDQKVIGCYLESIENGKKLMEIGYKYNPLRPVIILKPGRSKESRNAILSHTGALTEEYAIVPTALKQSGYIQVNNIGEMFHKIKAFAWQPVPKSNKTVIITNAGGPAVITTDLLIEKGLELASINPKTAAELGTKLPKTANIHNPVDVIGDALSDRYFNAMDIVLREEEVSSVIVILTPQIMTEIEKTAEYIAEMKKYNKTILVSFIGGTLVEKGMKLLTEKKIPSYHFPETAVDVLSSMVEYNNFKNLPRRILNVFNKSPFYSNNHFKILEYYNQAKRAGMKSFPESISNDIANSYGILAPTPKKCTNMIEALSLAKYPCVLKISSQHLIHKSDIKGVITNIISENELKTSYGKLESIIENNKIQNAGIEIQKYISSDIQLICGANRDKNYGSVLIFGQGGIYTETFNDISRKISPLSEGDISEMMQETRIYKILQGLRGQLPANREKIINTIKGIEYIMNDYEFIKSIDINPLIPLDDEIWAVDIKIMLEED